MAYSISFPDVSSLFNEEKSSKQLKELETFLNCCKGNQDFVMNQLNIYTVCGSELDSDVCVPVPRALRSEIAQDLYGLLIKGQKVNGKPNHWSNGCFGSRWCDLDAKKYGVTYVRCAFYSKSSYDPKKEWKQDKPFVIQITVEKTK
jgi:hypothetical protein